jgi:hypothetical protein
VEITNADAAPDLRSIGQEYIDLYGSIGTSDFEVDALGSRNIVVATPEKLDFALQNQPSLLGDVGLIVLDEGHMIGLGEREVRYEVQIQRLLKRADAHTRLEEPGHAGRFIAEADKRAARAWVFMPSAY